MEDAPKKSGGLGKFLIIGCLIFVVLGLGCVASCFFIPGILMDKGLEEVGNQLPDAIESETQKVEIVAKWEEVRNLDVSLEGWVGLGALLELAGLQMQDQVITEEEGTKLLEALNDVIATKGQISDPNKYKGG